MVKCKICDKREATRKGMCNICYLKDYRKKNREKIRKRANAYYLKHLDEIKAWAIMDRNIRRFGGNQYKAMERDNWECQICGMTNEQHIVIFGKNLNVHHLDGEGKSSKNRNDSLDNLQTLCFRCHSRITRENQLNELKSACSNKKVNR